MVEGSPTVHAVERFDHRWPIGRRLAAARALSREKFDLCLVFNPNQEAYLLSWWIGAARRVGIVHERRLFDLAVARVFLSRLVLSGVERSASRGKPAPHEVELTKRVLERAGISWAGDHLELPPADGARESARRLVHRTWPGSAPPIGFHLSTKWLGQGWTIEQVGGLLSSILRDRPDRRVLVTWGPDDASIAADLLELPSLGLRRSDGGDCRLDLAIGAGGRLLVVAVDFGWWMALLSSCSVVVTRDTGSLHVAAALARPVVAVYDPWGYAGCHDQFAPWRVPNRVITGGPYDEVMPSIRAAIDELQVVAAEVERSEAR